MPLYSIYPSLRGGRRGDETEVPVGLRMQAILEAASRVEGLGSVPRIFIGMVAGVMVMGEEPKRGARIPGDDGVRMVEDERSISVTMSVSIMFVGSGLALQELDVDGAVARRRSGP